VLGTHEAHQFRELESMRKGTQAGHPSPVAASKHSIAASKHSMHRDAFLIHVHGEHGVHELRNARAIGFSRRVIGRSLQRRGARR
jgi:hypothetical protein